jgi:hypothetical protein
MRLQKGFTYLGTVYKFAFVLLLSSLVQRVALCLWYFLKISPRAFNITTRDCVMAFSITLYFLVHVYTRPIFDAVGAVWKMLQWV